MCSLLRAFVFALADALPLQMRQIGNLFGVAIASTLVQNAVSHAPISKETIREILDNPPRLRSSESGFSVDAVATVLHYYQGGFRKVFLAAAIGSAISFVGAVLLIRHHSIEAAGQPKEEDEKCMLSLLLISDARAEPSRSLQQANDARRAIMRRRGIRSDARHIIEFCIDMFRLSIWSCANLKAKSRATELASRLRRFPR